MTFESHKHTESRTFMKCWTLQDPRFLDQSGTQLMCSIENSSAAWRYAYNVMNAFYEKFTNTGTTAPLIWLWAMDECFEHRGEEYELVIALEPNLSYVKDKVVVNLEIPSEDVLTSSYGRFNTLLEYCVVFNRRPNNLDDWRGVLEMDPSQPADPRQAVVGYLHREWITDVQPLKLELLREYGAFDDIPKADHE